MSSMRGTTRSGSSAIRARNPPSTEPAFAALAGPVTSVKGKRSNLGRRPDGKVAPANRYLTTEIASDASLPLRFEHIGRVASISGLDQAFGCRVFEKFAVSVLGQHHWCVLQLPADTGAWEEDPAGYAYLARLFGPFES